MLQCNSTKHTIHIRINTIRTAKVQVGQLHKMRQGRGQRFNALSTKLVTCIYTSHRSCNAQVTVSSNITLAYSLRIIMQTSPAPLHQPAPPSQHHHPYPQPASHAHTHHTSQSHTCYTTTQTLATLHHIDVSTQAAHAAITTHHYLTTSTSRLLMTAPTDNHHNLNQHLTTHIHKSH